MLVYSNTLFADDLPKMMVLQADNFEHIAFKRIKANQHNYKNQQLQIDVDKSASFLMMPFDRVRKITRVSFEWRSEGVPQIKNAQHEAQRAGDDAVFKLGLLLNTGERSINPFLPSWMKRVETLLKFPSENMVYLVADARHAAGEQWANPYNKRVTMIAMGLANAGSGDQQGWQQVHYRFETPVNVVALWLMSDGDNTDSRFTAYIKNIAIE